ncbi:unnamed protein product [Strongylus vulgaris]|uniref:Uncharacterized protein n=1 Tax=Strongylus vulgaris TaxID=40348 RepID=A0A3P7LR09_STRVU|nr:unnamed protein product [Strongylus vulgaris]
MYPIISLFFLYYCCCSFQLVLESAKKGEDATLCETLQQDLIQLKEYNAHLERQFQTQTDIIEALKRKLIEQKSFADLIHKLSAQDDVELIEDGLNNYIKSVDRETGRLAESIAYIVKICPYNSVDSSGKWLSNSSEDISPDSEGTDWGTKRKTLKAVDSWLIKISLATSYIAGFRYHKLVSEVQCGADGLEQRSASTKNA